MARIRTIKPEFWTDDALTECSLRARLLFIGMWTFADDRGNIERSAKQMKMRIFPADGVDVEPLLTELMDNDLLIEYVVGGKKYLHIRTFLKHQVINRPSKSGLPEYNESLRTHGVITEDSRTEGNGKEGNGKDKEATPEPFRLLSCEEIENGSKSLVLDGIDRLAEEIYRKGKWSTVHACKNNLLKQNKNERAIFHALTRIYLKDPPPDDPWAFCVQIMKKEDGNYNARDYQKNQG